MRVSNQEQKQLFLLSRALTGLLNLCKSPCLYFSTFEIDSGMKAYFITCFLTYHTTWIHVLTFLKHNNSNPGLEPYIGQF